MFKDYRWQTSVFLTINIITYLLYSSGMLDTEEDINKDTIPDLRWTIQIQPHIRNLFPFLYSFP